MAFGIDLRIGDLRQVCSWIVLLAVMNKGVYGQDCFFRHDLCGWSNTGDVDWVQKSMATGPVTEHCAEVPLVGDTSERQATLTSMQQPHVMSMLGFFYRLGAPNTLTVTAELDASGTQTLIWTVNGTEADTAWVEVDVAVPESTHFKISFLAGIPENSSSVVALTNITLRFGDDQCASMPCLNGGFCIDGNNSFTCVCSSGFKGEMCQIDTNAPPETTTLPPKTTTKEVTQPPSSTHSSKQPSPKMTTRSKTAPPTDATVKYATVSPAPSRASVVDPQTGGLMDDPVMVAVVAVGGVLLLAALATAVWTLLYCKKRSWRPRYHERGLSMESVSHSESMQGKWTSTVDIAGSLPRNDGSQPDLKAGLTPVEENHVPRKVENIYVTQHTLGILNNGYNIDKMY